ncbi:hypothetical protein TWF481_002251 [Arthrobotrys musiformis]|uniref:Uncharacterized protein n=1 Tax=Arthrobotrys musiformis TaxID=47236 RepID=A0AAV9VSM4_9PEZI
MQFTTILLSILASATLISAAPVAKPLLGAVAGVVGIGCAGFPDACKAVGDGIKSGVQESGNRKLDSVHSDGGVSIGFGQGGFTPGSFKKE